MDMWSSDGRCIGNSNRSAQNADTGAVLNNRERSYYSRLQEWDFLLLADQVPRTRMLSAKYRTATDALHPDQL